MQTWVKALVVASAAGLVLAACGGDDDSGGSDNASNTTAAPAATTTAAPETLHILVTNDDGIDGQGMADLVDGLQGLPNTEVKIVVPDSDRTGTDGRTTPGGVTATDGTTQNGDDATTVSGFPADSVIYALDTVYTDAPPDLVVSGINAGQNLGPVVNLSGTVGAARQAAALGVPALAVSQGLPASGGHYDYAAGVQATLDWINENRDDVLADDTAAGQQAPAVNLNIPSCASGEPRGPVDVPLTDTAPSGQALAAQDCTSTEQNPANDVEAFVNGFTVTSDLPEGTSHP